MVERRNWRWRTGATRSTDSTGGGVTNHAFLLLSMSDGDDSAALWKVNRTIHELVKDRVQQCLPKFPFRHLAESPDP